MERLVTMFGGGGFLGRYVAQALFPAGVRVRIAPALPVSRPSAKFQPAFAYDAGRAIAAAVLDPRSHGGRTYELGGPQVLTMHELMAFVCAATARNRPIVDIPD